MQELHNDNINMQYQFDQFDKRNKSNKHYGQNPRVYDYYRKIGECSILLSESVLSYYLLSKSVLFIIGELYYL